VGTIGIIPLLITAAIPGILVSDQTATADTGGIIFFPAVFAERDVICAGVVRKPDATPTPRAENGGLIQTTGTEQLTVKGLLLGDGMFLPAAVAYKDLFHVDSLLNNKMADLPVGKDRQIRRIISISTEGP